MREAAEEAYKRIFKRQGEVFQSFDEIVSPPEPAGIEMADRLRTSLRRHKMWDSLRITRAQTPHLNTLVQLVIKDANADATALRRMFGVADQSDSAKEAVLLEIIRANR